MPDFKRGGIEREINQKIHRMAVRKFKKKKKKRMKIKESFAISYSHIRKIIKRY